MDDPGHHFQRTIPQMKARALLGGMFMLFACGGAAAPMPADDATPVAAAPSPVGQAIAPWDATRCGDDADIGHKRLMGRAPEALEAAFGSPTRRERFRVGEPAGTFYGELGRRLSGPKHSQAGAPAQALTWTKKGCDFTVLFVERAGAFRAVSAFEAGVGADF
jgi:hypothetical protein